MKFVTDVISVPGAAQAHGDDDAATAVIAPTGAPTDSMPPTTGEQPLAWAPIEPAPKKRRLGLWIGLGLGVLAIGAGAASMVLIAPGTTVAGIPVGWMTPGAAADAIDAHLAETEVTLTGDGEGTVLTGADLGASVDATALADKAFAAAPMWNLGAWMGEPVPAEITFDTEKATSALRAAVPTSFEDPIDAGVVFDAATAAYVSTPAEAGTGIDVSELNAAFVDAVAGGSKTLEFPGGPAEAPAAVSDDDAAAMAAKMNTLLTTIGFYVGGERTVPIDAATAATWLTVVDDGGQLRIEADAQAISATSDYLALVVDRAPVSATSIVDSGGNVLREEQAGVTGRAVGDTSDVAEQFAQQLAAGDGVFALSVTEVPFETVTLFRRIDVDLSTQQTTLYENGAVVQSWAISSGLDATPTPTGNFTVFAHTEIQDMIGEDYVTKDVQWNTWFARDIAFHGAYWHNNFGNQMSHGCVNMPVSVAKYVFDWAPVGLEVSVHH